MARRGPPEASKATAPRARWGHVQRLILLYSLLGYTSTQLHEAGHRAAAALLRVEFTLGFNRWQISPSATPGERVVILAAGPATSLLLVGVGLAVAYRCRRWTPRVVGSLTALFNSLFFLIPLLPADVARRPGDEGWLALQLGVSPLAIRVPLAIALALAVVAAFIKLNEGLKRSLWGLLALLVTTLLIAAVIVGLDVLAWTRIEAGDPLFSPTWGVSRAVLLLNGLALVALAVLLRRASPPAPLTSS